MFRWKGKVAVITGASSGIGAAIAKDLTKAGMISIGVARRINKLEELKSNLWGLPGQFYPYCCDITNEDNLKQTFKSIHKRFGGVNVLINNAGRTSSFSILNENNSMKFMRDTIDLNLFASLNCIKEMFEILKITGDDGHIVNISSMSAHMIPISLKNHLPKFNIYPSSKHALKVVTEILRQELMNLNPNVKISMISPGLTKTEIPVVAGIKNTERIFEKNPFLRPEDVSDACLYILGTSRNVQIHDLIIKPVGEIF